MHELLRQYATEKLAASPDAERQLRDQHCAFYAVALQRWDAELKGPRQLAALAEIEADIGNARAAWDWAVEQRDAKCLDRAMGGLCRFYEWRGRYEEGDAACRAAADALALAEDRGEVPALGEGARLRTRAIAWRGALGHSRGHMEPAKDLLDESLALLEALASTGQDVRRERAFALRQMGLVLFDLAQYEDAWRCYEGSLASYRALGDRWEVADALHDFGQQLALAGVLEQAEALLRESLAIMQAMGDPRGTATSLVYLGSAALRSGRMEESEGLTRESVAAFQVMGDRPGLAEALFHLSNSLLLLGKPAEARSKLEESIAISRELRGSGSCFGLAQLGVADLFLGNYEAARASAQMALSLAQETGYEMGIGYARDVLAGLAIAEGEYARAHQLSQQACSVLEGVFYSSALVQLAYAALGLGQPGQARQHLCEASRLASERRDLIVSLQTLPAIALLLADQGEVERAVELYVLASRYPFVANAQWFEDIAGKQIAAAAKALPPDVVAAAQERGRARDLDATVKELLAELREADG